MKSAEELRVLVELIYDKVEHGKMNSALDILKEIQKDAYLKGLTDAHEAAKKMIERTP